MPKIGLVLGAGGAVGGAFHAGVLATLAEETGWDPRSADVIVGTSAGSVTGAALRAGLAAPDLAARAEGRPLSDEGARLLAGMPPYPVLPQRVRRVRQRPTAPAAPGRLLSAATRPWEIRMGTLAAALLPPGEIDMSNIAGGFDALFPKGWPDKQLWVVAVRLEDGHRVVFGREDTRDVKVPEAVAASCAVPSVFSPVTIDGVRYVDGGAWSPTNVDLVSRLGLDVVVVSSPMSIAGRLSPSRVRLDSAARRLFRAYLTRESVAVRRRGTRVLVFQPTAGDLTVMGLNAMDDSRRPAVSAQARRSAAARLARADAAPAVELLAAAGARS
jgi:NTE family protein